MLVQKKRISYGTNEYQFGDLRIPEGTGSHPVVIVIHGGFWRAKFGLDDIEDVAIDLTNRGIATWSIEYRRVGQEGGGWPGTFKDVGMAVDYLYKLEELYPLRLNEVFTLGHSAGGHLALWVAARHRLPKSSILNITDQPLPIAGVISLAGICDLEAMEGVHHIHELRRNVINNPVYELLRGNPTEVADRYDQASPIQLLPLNIPQILIHGSLDIHVPIGISMNYKHDADKKEDSVKFVQIPAAEHFQLIDPHSKVWAKITIEIFKLFDKTGVKQI